RQESPVPRDREAAGAASRPGRRRVAGSVPMSTNLHLLLNDLADEMTDTNYKALRGRVETTSRKIGRRRAMAVAFASVVAVVAVAGAGYALLPRFTLGPAPATGETNLAGTPTPSATASSTSSPASSDAAPTNLVPGTLVYLNVKAGQ